MASHGVERRIAERGPVGPIPVTLVATEARKGLLGGVKRSVVHESAHIVDLSVSGAAVVARTIEGLTLRAAVELHHGGGVARAVVKRLVPRDDGRTLYGLDFTSLDPTMRQELFAMVEGRRPEDLEWRWLQAH